MPALFLSKHLAMASGEYCRAMSRAGSAERAEAIYRRLGYRRRLYRTLHVKGWELTMLDRGTEAEAILPELEALEAPGWPAFVLSQRLNLHGVIFNYNGWRLNKASSLSCSTPTVFWRRKLARRDCCSAA